MVDNELVLACIYVIKINNFYSFKLRLIFNYYKKRARGLYSDADIYLFDDSLSAVDGTVGKFILNK